ncbi:hypothetical protein [Burkholderia ubonensis]|uniref:hypothetical protein n=1 Tax=Burkholderia ubonensis TaxID=101571 RepID=UPI000ADCE147|nr:hypothetical protein [Burkholderia ubonensis]
MADHPKDEKRSGTPPETDPEADQAPAEDSPPALADHAESRYAVMANLSRGLPSLMRHHEEFQEHFVLGRSLEKLTKGINMPGTAIAKAFELRLGTLHNLAEIGQTARARSAMFDAIPKSLAGQFSLGKLPQLGIAASTLTPIGAAYSLPIGAELSRLTEKFGRLIPPDTLGVRLAELQKVAGQIQSPWLRATDPLASIAGLAGLQKVGHALHQMPAFEPAAELVLRENLGDWRDPPAWPQTLEDDPQARTEFYVERGFNRDLTDFPDEAFDSGLALAHLGNQDLGVMRFEEALEVPFSPELLTIQQRAKACFEILYIFEARLRTFIAHRMSEKFGDTWTSRRLPAGMHEEWLDKQTRAGIPDGAAAELIDFADFTDYERIICKKDNWREVFEPVFKVSDLVKTAFYFLRPIRVTIMHARQPTYEDELFLRAEVTKLIRFIRTNR